MSIFKENSKQIIMDSSLTSYSNSEYSKCILAEALFASGENIFTAMKIAGLSDKVIERCKDGTITLEIYKQRQLDFIN